MNAAPGRKRRATRACCHCRGRKVRCDVMEYGSPCTNCRLDRVECMTLERRRKRTADEIRRCDQSCSSRERGTCKLRVLAKSKNIERAQPEELPPMLARDDGTGFILPQYTRSLPVHLDEDDIRFLAKKGALSVPATCLRNKLLTSYAHHVHSDMPLLELDGLIRPIIQNDKHHPVSLLLLQAVLFAASAFVNIEDLQAAGFESRIQARATFFQRARLLYEFNYEEDRLILVQSLLLMSYWEESPSGLKDGWHWLALSLSVAQTIGLHRKADKVDDVTRIRTRLWWCIYTRDCLMALDMRHLMHISNIEFDTKSLTIDHFELEMSEPTVNSIGYSGLLGNAEHQRSLAVIFIEKIRICHFVKNVLQSQYSVEFGPLARAVPIRATKEDEKLTKCAQDLHIWVSSLAPEARYTSVDLITLTKAEGILHVQRSSLRMIYLGLMGALYRPHIHLNQSTKSEMREKPKTELFSAAEQVMNIVQDLEGLSLMKFLPPTAVTVLYSAGITHLLGLQDMTSQVTSLQHLSMCLYSLVGLREIYSTSGSAASFLEAAIGRIMPFYSGAPVSSAVPRSYMDIEEETTPSSIFERACCPTYALSASDTTEEDDSPLSGLSPESLSSRDFGTGHDNFLVIDIDSELGLGEIMCIPNPRLMHFDKGQT